MKSLLESLDELWVFQRLFACAFECMGELIILDPRGEGFFIFYFIIIISMRIIILNIVGISLETASCNEITAESQLETYHDCYGESLACNTLRDEHYEIDRQDPGAERYRTS